MLGLLSALAGCAFIPAPCRNLRFRAELQLGLLVIRRGRGPGAGNSVPLALGLCVSSRRRSEHGVNPPQCKSSWIETVLTFHPVLPMRAAIVAAAATALGVLALANLTSVQPRAGVAPQRQLRAPIAASVACSRDSLAVLSRADSLER
jgi:hypothetical protein